MFGWIWALLVDKSAFAQAVSSLNMGTTWERIKPTLKAALLTFGASVATGQVDLGKFGYWIAPAVIGVSAFMQKNPDLLKTITGLSDSQRQQLSVHLATLMPPTTQEPPKGI